ncbi:MAG: hypothetical protein AAFQ53_05320 [Bacteroidota bacterium]
MTDPLPDTSPSSGPSFGRVVGYNLLGFGALSMLFHASPGSTSDASFLVFVLAVFHAGIAGLAGLVLLFIAAHRRTGLALLLSGLLVLTIGTTYCLNTFSLGPMH